MSMNTGIHDAVAMQVKAYDLYPSRGPQEKHTYVFTLAARIGEAGEEVEINYYFHNKHLFTAFIEQLKKLTFAEIASSRGFDSGVITSKPIEPVDRAPAHL